MPDFIHNDPEFKELLNIVSSKKEIDIAQINYIVKKLENFKEEGSTTKWFSEEFLLTSQIDKLNLNSS